MDNRNEGPESQRAERWPERGKCQRCGDEQCPKGEPLGRLNVTAATASIAQAAGVPLGSDLIRPLYLCCVCMRSVLEKIEAAQNKSRDDNEHGLAPAEQLNTALVATVRALFPCAALFLVLLLASCGDRPLAPPGCHPGLDGGPAWCETTGEQAASCGECPR